MMNKDVIKKNIHSLKNPENNFKECLKKDFENIVFSYLKGLILIGIIAAVLNLIINLVKTVYLDVFLTVDIDYSRFLNYAIGQAFMILLFYGIIGTFVLFFLSMVLRIFIKKIKYTELIRALIFSLSPLLLFAWTPRIAMVLLIWSIFLFIVAIKSYK